MAKYIKAEEILSYTQKDQFSFFCFENPNVERNDTIVSWMKSNAPECKEFTFLICNWMDFFRNYDLRKENCEPNDVVVFGYKKVFVVTQNTISLQLENILINTKNANKKPPNLRSHWKPKDKSKLYHFLLKPCWKSVNKDKFKDIKPKPLSEVAKVSKVVADDDAKSCTSMKAHASLRLSGNKKISDTSESSQTLKRPKSPESDRQDLKKTKKDL